MRHPRPAPSNTPQTPPGPGQLRKQRRHFSNRFYYVMSYEEHLSQQKASKGREREVEKGILHASHVHTKRVLLNRSAGVCGDPERLSSISQVTSRKDREAGGGVPFRSRWSGMWLCSQPRKEEKAEGGTGGFRAQVSHEMRL